MFLFTKKYKTPVSTYTNDYRPPCSVRKTDQEQTLQPLWKENKFVTQGLTVPPLKNPASQGQPEHLINTSMQEYYRNKAPQDTPTCGFCFAEKYKPVFVNDDKYISWRNPYSSTAWNKHSSYPPLQPKETRMETSLNNTLMPYSTKAPCLRQLGNCPCSEGVTGTLHRVPVYSARQREPLQVYYSPCSGHHYCLRGTNCCVGGASAIRRHIHALEDATECPMLRLQHWNDLLYIYTPSPAVLYILEP
ncbi:Spermatid-specific manchette-related protein 1 [Colius striatus]|uniref:Spermatid-specific manchette-related protein 1 n=1 Tax=Colius striatus TaxID=57412 RepID=A0A091L2W5_COLST|nr:Spermatid-specific manchette-related protein 1 [Colius striatus]